MIGLGSDKNIPKLLSTTKQLFGQIIVLVDYKILPAMSKIRWQMQYCVISKMSPQFFSHSDQAASDLVPSSFLAMHIFIIFSDQPSKVKFSFLQCFDFFSQMSNNRRSWKIFPLGVMEWLFRHLVVVLKCLIVKAAFLFKVWRLCLPGMISFKTL